MPDADDLVDEDVLADYLRERLGDADSYSVERHDQGFSNETLFVTWGERELVLRRPPPGATAETAHDVLREYRAMDALQDTDVPVPRTVAACDDDGLMGFEFYVMERLDGDVLRFSEPGRFSRPGAREEVGRETVETLAAIHNVDFEAVGLGEFGRPEGFTERQVERWTKQIEWAFEETTKERDVPTLRDVGDWLAENAPSEHPHALVHGDYKLDNLVFAPGTPPRVAGVLDWEMSTLGDPLCDLGWLLFFWPMEKDPTHKLGQTFMPNFVKSEGYPSREQLVDVYVDLTGYDVSDLRFYRTLAVYKMAGLGEMFYARYLMGHSDSSFYAMMDEGVPLLAEEAMEVVEGDRPL
ncbi:MAG: phosphotransferase family protein [Halobacteriales archaeon]